MSYTINKTNGDVLTTVNDGTINTGSSSLTLIGKNYAGYGEFQNDYFIQLIEYFANSTTPPNPLAGQLYFNSINKSLNVYIGTGWKSVGSLNVQGSAPTAAGVGELWFDTVNEQLFAWNGTTWILVGPTSSATQPGQSGVVAGTVTNGASTEYVLKIYVAGALVAVVSTKLLTNLVNVITELPGYGYTTLRPGYNFVKPLFGSPPVEANVGIYNAIAIETSAIIAGTDGTGTTATAGTIQGDWTLVAGSKLLATYADLAERYAADGLYTEGTIVQIGGPKEVTLCMSALSENVFGVISSKPAFVMNSEAGNDETHPPVALIGRVPVRVSGRVFKGQWIVCAGVGVGRAAQTGEATQFNVIGRALETNETETEKLVIIAIK